MNQIVGIKKDGRTFLALVLEPGNIHKLRDLHKPISIRVEDFFPEGIPKRLELEILYSETPLADSRELAQMAEMVFDERKAVNPKPHCPECRSTIEQLGVQRNETPVALVFCSVCGCIFGTIDPKIVQPPAKDRFCADVRCGLPANHEGPCDPQDPKEN